MQNGRILLEMRDDVAIMTLNDPANLVRVVGHQGPHPQEYHQLVWEELSLATKGVAANSPAFREALRKALAKLAKEIQTPRTRLNQLVTGGGSK